MGGVVQCESQLGQFATLHAKPEARSLLLFNGSIATWSALGLATRQKNANPNCTKGVYRTNVQLSQKSDRWIRVIYRFSADGTAFSGEKSERFRQHLI